MNPEPIFNMQQNAHTSHLSDHSFFREYIIDVTVEVGQGVEHCTLSFGRSGLPVLSLKNYASATASPFFSKVRESSNLTCTALNGHTIYTLNGTELSQGQVFADYVIIGNSQMLSDKLELHLTGISVWLEERRRADISESSFSRNIDVHSFCEPFCFQSNRYTLSTDHHFITYRDNPVECHFGIEHTLVVQKVEGHFTLTEAKVISHELRNLFSLLIGASLSINEVWLFSHEKPARGQWLYFPSAKYSQNPLEHAYESLCAFSGLTEGKCWGRILSRYFANDAFRNIWCRLLPSYGKMGVWEYDILSRVIMLEMYAGVKTTLPKRRTGPEMSDGFKRELLEHLNSFAASRDMEEIDKTAFERIKKSVFSKPKYYTKLRDKYDALMAQFSPSLRLAISFTDDDFSRIKKFRDSTAHGLYYERHSSGENITHEMQLSDRLLILLMCFVYVDLGFTEVEIAVLLQKSRSRFIGNAGLNKRELSKLNGSAIFLSLATPHSKLNFKSYEQIVVNYSAKTDTWHLNETLTQKVQTEWLNSGIANLQNYILSLITLTESQTIEVGQRAYIESGGAETEHYNTVIIRG